MTNMECERIEIALCESHFPLLSRFQDLEQRRSNVFFIDSTHEVKNPCSLLRALLHQDKDGYSKLGCNYGDRGYTFVEARESLKNLTDAFAHGYSRLSQNNLRICIFFLCHGIFITETNVHDASEQSLERKNAPSNSDGVHSSDKVLRGRKSASDFDSFRWLEMKTAAFMMLWKITESLESAFDDHQDILLAGALIRTAAITCLVHQKWGDRGTALRVSLQNLRSALSSILWHPFLHPLPFAPEIAQQTFDLLTTLCTEHKYLISFMVDMLADLISVHKPSGLAFLSKVVHGIKSNPKADTGGKRCHQDDECDLALAMIADFAVRKDAILVAGLYLGTLLPLLQSQRAVVRKHVFDIVGGCLLHYHAFCPSDQQALLTLHSFFLRDRDATCRLKALTCLDCSLKEDNVIKGEIYCALTSMVLRRIVDKSKIVRLKALQILQNLFTKSPVLNFLEHIKKDIVIQVSMLLQISADSPHFCKETIEAAGKVLCAPYLKGSSMVETLDGLLSCERSSATFQVILRVLHFHLDSCGQWLQFLGSRSEKLMNTVEGFLIASMNEQETFATSLPNFMMRACLEIQNQALDEVMLLGSLRMIAFLMPLDCSVLPQQQDFCWALVEILTARTQNLSSISQSEKPLQKSVIKWVLKALAAVFKKNKRIFTIDMLEILERNLVNAYNNGIDGCADCIYSLTSPHTLSKMILLAYEEKLQVLVSPMPLKVLHGYLVFIGDLSRSYQFACDSLIRRLREVQKEISVSISCEGNISEFDYLQQEEQKAREEDAISRFICILLDSNSIPGCFVPFLHELASNSILPPLLRTSALQSLGNYMISSTDLAEKYRSSLESLLQDREADIKLSALFLAEKLILAFPNDYLPVIETVLSLLHDEAVRDAAFVVYANLLLEKKFKLDVLLGPICSFLCDDDEKIRSIAIYLLKRLLHDAGKGKHNLLMSLWNHCTSTDSHKQLVRVLVEHVLDATDLQSDELASAMLQILTLGHNSIAFLGSFLHPSLKVIRTLDFYLSSCPPKINLKGDSEACEYVSQFVRNYRAFKAAATPEKELLGRVLEKLQKRSSRKRKGHSSITKPDDNACNSLVEYEKAIENFKRCEITSCSLWDLFRHDI